MSEQTVAIQALVEALEQGTLRAHMDLMTTDVVLSVAERPLNGREPVLLIVGTLCDAIRDAHLRHEIVSDSPGLVVLTFEAKGVQRGELFGVPPSETERRMSGAAIVRFAGAAISGIRLFSDMAPAFGAALSADRAEPRGLEGEHAATSDAPTVHDIWMAGIGAVAAAEEYGTRLFTTLRERGKAWDPAKAKTRATETIGSAASAATAAVKVLGGKLRTARSTDDGALAQISGGPAAPVSREEFEALKRQVDGLAARPESESTVPRSPTETTIPD